MPPKKIPVTPKKPTKHISHLERRGDYLITNNGDIEIMISIPIESLGNSKKCKKEMFRAVDVLLDMLNKIQEDVGLNPDLFDIREKK
jgi:hypothetical protein